MADENQALNILITTKAELAGAKSLEQSLEQSIGKAKALGDLPQVQKLSGQLEQVRDNMAKATAANATLTDSVEKAGEAAEAGNEHFEGSRRLFSEIDRVAPGMGEAVRSAFEGPLGAVLLLVSAVYEAKQAITEYDDELDKEGDAAYEGHQQNVKRLQEGWLAAKTKLAEYFSALTTAGEQNDPIKKQLDNIRQLRDAQIEASHRVQEELGKQELLYARAHGATPAQLQVIEDRQRQEQASYERAKSLSDGPQALKEEQQRRLAENDRLKAEGETATREASEARDKADEIKQQIAEQQAKLDPTSDAGKEFAKKQQEAIDNLQAASNLPDEITPTGGVGLAPVDNRAAKAEAIRLAQEESDRLQRERADEQRRLGQLKESYSGADQIATTSEKLAAAKTDAAVTNQGRLRELPGEINQADQVQGTKDAAQSAVDALNYHGARQTQTLGELENAVKLTEAQKQAILERITNHLLTVQQAYAGLQQRMIWLEQQQAAIRDAAMNH